MSYYQNRYNLKVQNFPNTEYIWKGTVSLPVYSGLTEKELEYVCLSVTDIFGKEICTIINDETLSYGKYVKSFNAKEYNLSSGVYYFKFSDGNKQKINKIIYKK